MNKISVNIDILGKTYQVNCPENEVESLKQAAQLLEEKMKSTRESGAILSNDRIAVITSLNLVHQIMLLEQQSSQFMQTIQQRLYDIQGKVDAALAENAQMELPSAE